MSEAIAACIAKIRGDVELLAAFGERIRTGYAGQVDERPYCLLWEIGNTPTESLAGETELDVASVQIDVYADGFAGSLGANHLGRRIRDIFNATRGNVAEVWISSMMRTGGPRQNSERIGTGADSVLARVTIDYRIHYRPTRT